MIEIYQRRMVLFLLGLQSIGSGLMLVLGNYADFTTRDILTIGIAFIFITTCFGLYWRYRWPIMISINIINAIFLIGGLILTPFAGNTIATIILLPAALAVVTIEAEWTLIAGFSTYLLVFIRADSGSAYREADQIIVYSIVIMCLFSGRRIVEQAQQENLKALQDTQNSQNILEETIQQAQTQASILKHKHREQTKLVEQVSHLELPFILIAEQVLLVPLLGHLSPERIQRIGERLLGHINREPIKHIIIDLSGVYTINPSLTHHLRRLIQSIQLLGSSITLSGILPDVARELASQRITLKDVQIVQTPYDILEQRNKEQIKPD